SESGHSLIELTGFGWRYAGRGAWAVRDVDLRIERGERVLLLGLSGAGKSTLLAALAGLLTDESGERAGTIAVDGRAGVLFQDPQTQLVMARCGDDVAFGPENLGVPAAAIWPRVRAAVDAVGFGYPLDRSTHALSGGEQQRLALAGVLAVQPSVLLLDEPTANLDPPGAALVRQVLARLDTTVVLVEHRVAEALPLVDRVVVLTPDGIRADGTAADVFARYGDELADGGVWVPDHPVLPRRAAAPAGAPLLTARSVAVPGRLAPTDLDVCAGAAVAVTGPNGAGKSTLALALGGLLRPGSGTVRATPALAGADAAARPPHAWRAAALATRIGSVFQNPEHQFVTGRVRDELALGPRRAGTHTRAAHHARPGDPGAVPRRGTGGAAAVRDQPHDPREARLAAAGQRGRGRGRPATVRYRRLAGLDRAGAADPRRRGTRDRRLRH